MSGVGAVTSRPNRKLRVAAALFLLLYTIAFLVFCIISLQRDEALGSVSRAPIRALGPEMSHRVDYGPFFDAEALLASLEQRPFNPSEKTRPNVGLLVFEGGYLWMGAEIGALDPAEPDWTVWIDDRFARDARLIVQQGETTQTIDWHYGDPANLGLGNKTHPIFDLARDELDGATLWVALSSYGGLRGDLFVAPRAVFEQDMVSRLTLLTFLNGAVGALAVYLGAIGLRLREPAMAYASGMAFFLMIRNFGETGAHHGVLLPDNPTLADLMLYGTQPVAVSFWLLFTLAFIGLKTRAPRLDAALKLVALILPVQGILIVLKGGFWPEMPFNTSAAFPTLIGMACGIGVALWQVIAGNRRALYFLLCWTPLALGLVLRMSVYMIPDWNPELWIFARQGTDLTLSLLALAVLLTVDLRQRERRLTRIAERNAQRARDYAEIGTDGAFEADPRGVVRTAAGPLARMLGMSPGVSVAVSLPGMPAALANGMVSAPVRTIEFPNISADGEERWISLSSTPITDDSGLPDGYRAVVRDVTDSVKERESEARRNTLAALGHLAGGIAHEVNNLLHPIISLSRRVGERYVSDPDGKRLLELVVTSGVRAGEIVKSVLRAYTPEGFAGAPVPLERAVRDATDTVEATLPATCKLETYFEAVPLPEVRIGEMIQVISNLASNSLRAMGGSGRLSIRLVSDPDGPVLVVADSGPGMSEDMRRRASEPFVTGSQGGVGLGLSIVRRIVSGWNARLEIASEPEQGTTIRIAFPAETRLA